MTRNRQLTSLLGTLDVTSLSISDGRLSLEVSNGSILSFNTTAGNAPTLHGAIEAVLDDDTTLRIVTVTDGNPEPTDFPLTSNPAVLVRDSHGEIAYAD